jgi:hypothetical protein
MSKALPLSQIIRPDALFASPVDSQPMDSFPNPYYYSPVTPSSSFPEDPVSTAHLLKMRPSLDPGLESDQLCIPTRQLFDFSGTLHPITPPPSSPEQEAVPLPTVGNTESPVSAPKRPASPPANPSKKRTVGERISTKDFVPPDVSGLSKREARLVKNRAAAFLSRQRKREEFEAMEMSVYSLFFRVLLIDVSSRVADLERENARLKAMAQNGNASGSSTASGDELLTEVDNLRTQLAMAQERERELSAELSAKSQTAVKAETNDSPFLLSNSKQSPNKSASFGLMVCPP